MRGPKGFSHDRITINLEKHGIISVTRHRAGILKNLYLVMANLTENPGIIAEVGANQEMSIPTIFSKATIDRFDIKPSNDGIQQLDISKPPPKEFRNIYDVVTGIELIEHVYDIKKAIKNLFMMAKKGGQVIISTPFCYHIHTDKVNKIKDYHRPTGEFLEQTFLEYCDKKNLVVSPIVDECCNEHLPWGYFTRGKKK